YKIRVLGSDPACLVVIGSGFEKRHVGLGFGIHVEVDAALRADDCPSGQGQNEQFSASRDTGAMPGSDRTHLDNVPVNEFHTFLRTEDANLSHAQKLVRGKTPSFDLRQHDLS